MPARQNSLSSAGAQVLSDAVQVYGSRVLSLALNLARGFILARLLGPQTFGQYNLITLITLYVSLVGPGFRDVAHREIPYFAGQGHHDQVQRLKDTAFTIELLFRVLISGGVFLGAFFVRDPVLRNGLMITALVLLALRVFEYYQLIAITSKQFAIVSRAAIVHAIVLSAFIFATIVWLNVYSGLLAPAVAALVTVLYYRRSVRLGFRFRVSWAEVKRILRPGLGLTAMGLAFYAYMRADQTIVAAFLDNTALGYYGLAAFVIQFLAQLPSNIVTVIQPRLYERLGQSSAPRAIYQIIAKPSWGLAFSMALGIGLLWTAGPAVIQAVLPEYAPVIPALNVLLVGLFFASIGIMPYTLLYAPGVDRQAALALVWVGAAGVSAGLGYVFISLGMGIEGIAIAAVVGRGIAVSVNFIMAQKYYLEDSKAAAGFYVSLLLPLAYVGIVFLGLQRLPTQDLSPIANAVVRGGAMVLAYIPFLLYAERRTGLPSQVYHWGVGVIRRRSGPQKSIP